MKRPLLVSFTAVSMLIAASAFAGQHGHSGTPKTAAPKSAAPKPAHATSPHGSPKATTTTAHGHASKPKTTTHGSAASGSPKHSAKTASPPRTTAGTTTTSTATLSPVQQKLQRNTNLASKLQSRLPAGSDVTTAAAGFRNLGQFVAAVNVSNNLGIPFADLKTRMVDSGMSLGQAIQDARPSTTDTATVVRRAESDADTLIRSTETSPTTGTKKTKPKTTARHGSGGQ